MGERPPDEPVEADDRHRHDAHRDHAEEDEEQRQLEREDRILDPATGNYSREWMANWVAFEKLRNRYNGMPPKQLVLGSSNERRS